MMSIEKSRQCIAIGCHLHKQCQLPVNYKAPTRIWPPLMGKLCEHFVWRRDEDND